MRHSTQLAHNVFRCRHAEPFKSFLVQFELDPTKLTKSEAIAAEPFKFAFWFDLELLDAPNPQVIAAEPLKLLLLRFDGCGLSGSGLAEHEISNGTPTCIHQRSRLQATAGFRGSIPRHGVGREHAAGNIRYVN